MFERVKRNRTTPADVHGRTRSAFVTPLLVLLVGAAGCGGPTGTTSPTGPSDGPVPTGSGDDVALAVTVVSAWPDLVVADAPTPPLVRITGDGTFRATVHDDDAEDWDDLTGRLTDDVLADLVSEADAVEPYPWPL